jgi:hypothetical protein
MGKTVFTRNELYELVWTEPINKISKKFNIPSTELRKACINMDIPLPEHGYWVKKSFGKQVTKQNLPSDYKGEIEISFNQVDEPNPTVETKKAKADLSYKVPSKLVNPDPLIIAAKKELETSTYMYDGLKSTKSGELSIRVAPKNIDRALRIFDSIIKLLRARHYKITMKSGEAYVIIDGIDFELSLREKLNHEKAPIGKFTPGTYSPSGKFIFKYEHRWLIRKEWTDTDTILLEDKLLRIIDDMEVKANEEKERDLERERERRVTAEEVKTIQEQEKRKEQELKNFKILLKQAHQWHEAVILENYIVEFEKKALEKGPLSDDMKNWIDWAKQKAEWFNPFIRNDDPFLIEEDRQNL